MPGLHSDLEVGATSCTMPPLAHTNTKIRQISNRHNSTKMDRIQEAIADLRLQDKPNTSEPARRYKIDCSKLSRHYNGVSHTNDLAYKNQRLLSNAQSAALIEYINDLTEQGL